MRCRHADLALENHLTLCAPALQDRKMKIEQLDSTLFECAHAERDCGEGLQPTLVPVFPMPNPR
jgi:hypothetical protein